MPAAVPQLSGWGFAVTCRPGTNAALRHRSPTRCRRRKHGAEAGRVLAAALFGRQPKRPEQLAQALVALPFG